MSFFSSKKAGGQSFSSRLAGVSIPTGVLILGQESTVMSNCQMSLQTLTVTDSGTLHIMDASEINVVAACLPTVSLVNSKLHIQHDHIADTVLVEAGSTFEVDGELTVNGEIVISAGGFVKAAVIRCKNIVLAKGARIEGFVTQIMRSEPVEEVNEHESDM